MNVTLYNGIIRDMNFTAQIYSSNTPVYMVASEKTKSTSLSTYGLPSEELYNLIPVFFIPAAIFLNIWWAFFPIPFLDWHMPIISIICFDISLCFTRNTHFKFEKLCPTKGKFWKDVPKRSKKGKEKNGIHRQEIKRLWIWMHLGNFSRLGTMGAFL